MLKGLVKIANRLDDLGLTKEADVIDSAIRKLAQIEGVPGGRYQDGRLQSTVPDGPTTKFYSSGPSSMQRLNAELSDIVSVFGSHELFRESKRNPPRASDTTWTKATQDAFSAFAKMVGAGMAADNWAKYALDNEYAPSVDGTIAFIEDHAPEANRIFTTYIGSRPQQTLNYSSQNRFETTTRENPPSINPKTDTSVLDTSVLKANPTRKALAPFVPTPILQSGLSGDTTADIDVPNVGGGIQVQRGQ
jgi:hypothetical protein